MLNQKGQAFSVFELMIAGVVAFAILIILLTVINGIGIDPSGNPKDAISTTLKQVMSGGSANTKNFSIDKDTQIFAADVATKASIDTESVFFFYGTLLSKKPTSDGGPGLTVDKTNSTPPVSYVSWTGSQSLKARAKVVCGATIDAAVQALSILGTQYNVGDSSDEVNAFKEYCATSQPCCAVILDKPSTN